MCGMSGTKNLSNWLNSKSMQESVLILKYKSVSNHCKEVSDLNVIMLV